MFAQFGAHAQNVEALFHALLQPLHDQIQHLQQQVAQPTPAIDQQQLAATVAAAVTQAQAQAHAQAPAPVPAPANPREPKTADPPIFSGDHNQTESFIRSVWTCFQLSPSRFPAGDEQRRILFTLGFIQGGTAGTWATNYTNKILDPTTPDPFATFQEFQEAFEKAFGNADRAQKARTSMASLRMKPGESVEEYTTAFEALAIHTGYNEPAHIEAYRSGLHHRILEKIYGDSNGQLPTDLAAWKTKARRLDNLFQ